MAKRNKNKGSGRQRNTTSLREHRQVGKTLSPPLMTLPALKSVPWLRDTFPDMLWLAMLITEHGDRGMLLAAKLLDRIDDVLDDPDDPCRPDGFVLTGQLTTFEMVPDVCRKKILEALWSDELFERAVPWVFARALMKYPDVPGMWLFNGWEGNEQIVSADAPERLLARVVEDHSHGQSPSATRVKFMVLRSWFKAGKVHLTPKIAHEWGEILPRYPSKVTEEERARIEPSIRASFLSFSDLFRSDDEETEPPSVSWAKTFWRSNWKLYECAGVSTETDALAKDSESYEAIRRARDDWRQQLSELSKEVLRVTHEADPDLYCPDRHEVLTGITHRMLRLLSAFIDSPSMWTMEHAAPLIRALVEARIILKWLAKKDDPALYERFKSYGRGRLKLLKLHLEEYRDGLSDPPPDLDAHIEYLDALVNQDLWEEFQEISIEGSFAKVDIRKMADEVGLLTEYRLVFAPASSNVHGEWAALDRYVLVPCQNPLHRRHRIPRNDVRILLGPELVESALGHASFLVDEYKASIEVEK